MRNQLKQAKKVVIKIGTSTLINHKGSLNRLFMEDLARQIYELRSQGKQFVIVSSGAIGLGNNRLRWEKKEDLVLNQCSASVGQNLLMNSYSEFFNKHNITIAQLLLTRENLTDKEKKGNIKNLIEKLIELGIIPIINENDSVSTEEITFGDNDLLSASVSNLIQADLLILLSDVEGLCRDLKTQEIFDIVKKIDAEIKHCLNGKKAGIAKGGIDSKIKAAQTAADTGTKTVLARGTHQNIIRNILNGEKVGTLFSLKK